MLDRTAAGVDSDNALTDSVSRDANIGDCADKYRPLCRGRKRDRSSSNVGVSVFGGFLPE